MIIYKPYKLPHKKFDIAVRMRKIRRSNVFGHRKMLEWFKRRKRW